MTPKSAALLQLLADEEPETVALIRAELLAGGAASLGEVRALLGHATGTAARHLREILQEIEAQQVDAIFAETCARFGDDGDLETAAWQLAATFLPREDFSEARATLDRWGAEVRRRLRKAASALDRIETLVEYLGDEVRLHGDPHDYYNVNHSLLPMVIETRLGIPISLSLIYMLVARRAGLRFEGVALPGHFIVRCDEHFFDPFDYGHRLGIADCRELTRRCGMELRPEHLEPATPRQILRRMLGNLFALSRDSDPELAAKIAGWIEALEESGGR